MIREIHYTSFHDQIVTFFPIVPKKILGKWYWLKEVTVEMNYDERFGGMSKPYHGYCSPIRIISRLEKTLWTNKL